MAQMKKSGPAKPAYKAKKSASKKITPGSVGKAVGKAVASPVIAGAKAAKAYTNLLTLPARTVTKQRKRSK